MKKRHPNSSVQSTAKVNRDSRYLLVQQKPPAVLCLAAFVFMASVPIATLCSVKWCAPSTLPWPILVFLGVSLLWILVTAVRPRRSGEGVKGIGSYLLIGLIVGAVSAGGTLVLAEIAAQSIRTTQVSELDSGSPEETVPVPVGSGVTPEPKPFDPVSQGNEPAPPTPEADVVKDVAQGAANQVTNSVVLPPGTRIVAESQGSNAIRITLEEKPGKFVRGLGKADFDLQSARGQKLGFDLLVMKPESVPVNSSISFLIDERIPLSTQQSSVTPAMLTVVDAATRAAFRLTTAGRTLRTVADWTSDPGGVRRNVNVLRESQGSALAPALSLGISDLEKQPFRRVMMLFFGGSPQELQRLVTAPLKDRLNSSDITLIVAFSRFQPTARQFPGVKKSCLLRASSTAELQKQILSITTRQDFPSYLIRTIDPHPGTAVRLTVGSGATCQSETVSFVAASP